jgi:propionyl-CoA carboxylase beta chain
VRRLFDFLPLNNREKAPVRPFFDDPARVEPSLDTLIPDNPNQPYDMKELILKVADEGDFFEIQKRLRRQYHHRLCPDRGPDGGRGGQPADGAGRLPGHRRLRKAARFVRFCDAFEIPILTLVDVPGFLPGTAQEYGGVIKHGAKLLFAYGEATVPKVTVITRKAYGGAYDVMASKHLRGDFNYAWPTAEIAVMGAKGATEILYRAELGDRTRSPSGHQGLRGPLRQPLRRGRARLHRRGDPPAFDAPPGGPRLCLPARQKAGQPLEKARQHPAVRRPIPSRMAPASGSFCDAATISG